MTKESIRTVLLVEDNPADARSLREMLDKGGSHETELTHVKRLTEAETYLAQHTVEIILLDLGLPDAQGLEAVRRVRAAAPRVPLVVLTGLEDESVTEAALQEGAQGCLIKGQSTPPDCCERCGMPSTASSWKKRCSSKRNAPRSRSTPLAMPLFALTSKETSPSSMSLRKQ